MKKPGTTKKASKCPNNRAFTNFCPHLSPLEEKRKGVREIRAPYKNVSNGDKRGQIVLNTLFIGVFGNFQFVPEYSICPRPGTKCRNCPLYRMTASLYICPICPRIHVLSRLSPPGTKFVPSPFMGTKSPKPLSRAASPLVSPVQKNR